jgi:predicted DNA-binding transcriptional regulator AlpA
LPDHPVIQRPNGPLLRDGDDMDDPDLAVLLTGREAAALLRLSERTMERHRAAGTGPQYLALGRAIRYLRRDLLDWIERAARQSTSEPTR